MGRAFIHYHKNLSPLHFELTIELVQAFLKKCPIHPYFVLRLISAREVTNVLEASWTGRFSNHKHRGFFTKGVRCSHLFAVFSTWTTLTSEVQRFSWQSFVEQTKFIYIKTSFSWHLANIVGKVVSSQGAVIF